VGELRTGARGWGLGNEGLPPPLRASLTRSICLAAQESLPILKKDCFLGSSAEFVGKA